MRDFRSFQDFGSLSSPKSAEGRLIACVVGSIASLCLLIACDRTRNEWGGLGKPWTSFLIVFGRVLNPCVGLPKAWGRIGLAWVAIGTAGRGLVIPWVTTLTLWVARLIAQNAVPSEKSVPTVNSDANLASGTPFRVIGCPW